MVLYKLMVVHWSIFTLFTQLLFCTSVLTNSDANETSLLCSQMPEVLLGSDGVESSLILELIPNVEKSSCKRQFRAPEFYSFYVRLQRINQHFSNRKSSNRNNNNRKYGSKKTTNTTGSCPLSISQSLTGEVLPPWRIDPCESEANDGKEEARLLQGRLNIIWNHRGNRPAYRLSITAIGNGITHCLEKEKFACLEFDTVPLLCISGDLVCDGTRNCPVRVNANNDEDPTMCSKLRNINSESGTIMKILRILPRITEIFASESSTAIPATKTVMEVKEKEFELIENNIQLNVAKKGSRGSLTGLSKYGPWGYLFLGMLLCGGALLVCGLWECCCRSHKPDPISLSDDVPTVFLDSNSSNISSNNVTSNIIPQPEELDPPPAYSVLFPTNKSSENINLNTDANESPQSTSGASYSSQNINSTQTQTD